MVILSQLWAPTTKGGGVSTYFWSTFPQNCMKMKNFGQGKSTSAGSDKHCLFSRIEKLAPWRSTNHFSISCVFYQIFGKYRVSISSTDGKYTVRNPVTATFLILFLLKFRIKVSRNNYFCRILEYTTTNLKEKSDRFQYYHIFRSSSIVECFCRTTHRGHRRNPHILERTVSR